MRVDGATINAAPRLRALTPVSPMLPEKYNDRSRALMALKRVESVAVRGAVERDGRWFHVIDVFFTLAQSHIPSRQSKSRASCARGDVQVLRRYSEFGNLRHEMYYHANSGHGINPCGFCAHLVDFISHGHSQPRVLTKLFRRGDDLCRLLDEYLNELLEMVKSMKTFGSQGCEGQELVPLLLKDFLLLDDEPFQMPDRFSSASTVSSSGP
ncbi:hypothetical protein PINS_up006389 [Pythium insidiosum]|nr:hypothetical protein PINS_up006389 [Pythium insidiosum]